MASKSGLELNIEKLYAIYSGLCSHSDHVLHGRYQIMSLAVRTFRSLAIVTTGIGIAGKSCNRPPDRLLAYL